MKNLRQKIPFRLCVGLVCVSFNFLSCHVCRGWLSRSCCGIVVPLAFAFLRRVISTNATFHEYNCDAWHKNNGAGGLWSVALLMNRDKAMLRDLDRRGETAILERVTVSVQTHMRVKESSHMQCVHDINVIACMCRICMRGRVSVSSLCSRAG